MELAGTHVVVTGGSQGIGLETARLLVAKGARVSIVARDAERLAAAAADVGGDTLWRSADVTDPGRDRRRDRRARRGAAAPSTC